MARSDLPFAMCTNYRGLSSLSVCGDDSAAGQQRRWGTVLRWGGGRRKAWTSDMGCGQMELTACHWHQRGDAWGGYGVWEGMERMRDYSVSAGTWWSFLSSQDQILWLCVCLTCLGCIWPGQALSSTCCGWIRVCVLEYGLDTYSGCIAHISISDTYWIRYNICYPPACSICTS